MAPLIQFKPNLMGPRWHELCSIMSDPRYRIKSERIHTTYKRSVRNIEMVIELVRAYYGIWLGLLECICMLMSLYIHITAQLYIHYNIYFVYKWLAGLLNTAHYTDTYIGIMLYKMVAVIFILIMPYISLIIPERRSYIGGIKNMELK